MNRLIIVGNGFDLAHGLKTSYTDFIEDYLTNILTIFYTEQYYNDPLIEIKHFASQSSYRYPYRIPINRTDIYDGLQSLMHDDWYNVDMKSNLLFKTINTSQELRWVDLENDFFDELVDCKKQGSDEYDMAKVSLLNVQFSWLKKKLEEYLTKFQFDSANFKPDPIIKKLFKGPIEKNDVLLEKMGSTSPRSTLFLNFNYTNTLNKYIGSSTSYSIINESTFERKDLLNHIHGELNNSKNPIIFGFGDEYNKHYLEFEDLKKNEFFEHIKSFAYFKTRNYHDLIRFLDQDKFQVYIVGHSCGISDRTMFREIFSHPNCRSIKIFYYQRPNDTNDFNEKTYDIARHFTDKGLMRKMIVSEPNSKPFPQYINPSAKK